MKALLLLTASGPIVVLTSHATLDAALLDKLAARGIRKFVAFEVPPDLAAQRYGQHFAVVRNDLHETDDLRILDLDGQRAYSLFRFAELGPPVLHEGA